MTAKKQARKRKAPDKGGQSIQQLNASIRDRDREIIELRRDAALTYGRLKDWAKKVADADAARQLAEDRLVARNGEIKFQIAQIECLRRDAQTTAALRAQEKEWFAAHRDITAAAKKAGAADGDDIPEFIERLASERDQARAALDARPDAEPVYTEAAYAGSGE